MTYFNPLRANNYEEIVDCVERFISSQLYSQGRKANDSPYHQIVYQQISRIKGIKSNDFGIYMLKYLLNIATGNDEIQISEINNYRTEIIKMFYEYGKV